MVKNKLAKDKGSPIKKMYKTCVACDLQKKPNAKFCKDHHPMYESIKLQAHNKGEMEAFHQVFSDEAKARSALAQFTRDNPPGKRFRTTNP